MIEVTLHNAHDILGVEKNATEAAIKKVVGYFNLEFSISRLQPWIFQAHSFQAYIFQSWTFHPLFLKLKSMGLKLGFEKSWL